MKSSNSVFLLVFYLFMVFGITNLILWSCNGSCESQTDFHLDLSKYESVDGASTWQTLVSRAEAQPFNVISLALFLFAIIHTFMSHHFKVVSKMWKEWNIKNNVEPVDSFGVEFLRFMGEVEVVFGIWVIPLFLAMAYYFNWSTATHYLSSLGFIEPMFVVVIMTLASTRPIIRLAEDSMKFFSNLLGNTAACWWWVILTIGPLSGSLITEPGAMTISATLLGKMFYRLRPSLKFSYATLGLLFTNISVGGVLTNFAAPPVLIVSNTWGWSSSYMLTRFGWKAIIGIIIANAIYYFTFRSEFKDLNKKLKVLEQKDEVTKEDRIPFWISFVHVSFLAWAVVHNHYPALFIGAFLLFLGFYEATISYQEPLNLKPPLLVGFFLAGLVIHGNLQGWWIAPLLTDVESGPLMFVASILTAFNDNAEITFLATLIPNFTETLKYAVVSGAVIGGGLTVIANAPNPLGQSVLSKYFYEGISSVQLLMGAIVPALVMGAVFYLFMF